MGIYNTGYRVGNLMDQQRMAAKGSTKMIPYGLEDYSPVPMGANGQAPGMEGVAPWFGSAEAAFKPKGAGAGMTALGLAAYAPAIAGDIWSAFDAPKYDTTVQGGDWSGYNPEMGLGDEILRQQAIGKGVEGVIGKTTGQTALKMAGTGASIGTSIMPGIGTAIGAAAGALGGALTGFFGGRRKKKKAHEAQAEMDRKLQQKAAAFSDVHSKARQEYQADRIALQQYT